MVFINDLLSSGDVQDLFNADDKEVIFNKSKAACKAATRKDTPQDVWNFFINRVKKNCHVCICFSPGENLRNKARKFPSIINSTVIDWFQPWPEEALSSVARGQLQTNLDEIKDMEYFDAVVQFMPTSFAIVGRKSKEMLDSDRRYTYITPKSFLELLKLFISMYRNKVNDMVGSKSKLESGLNKMKTANEQISILQVELKEQSVVISGIKVDAEAKSKVAKEKADIVKVKADKAELDEAEVLELQAKVKKQKNICDETLAKYLPIMVECKKIAEGIKEEQLKKIREFRPEPPAKIKNLLIAIRIMIAGQIEEFIPIEIDNKCMPKSNEPKAITGILNNTAALKDGFASFIKVISEFKYNPKNFDNLVANYPDYFVPEKKDEIAAGMKKAAGGTD